MKDGRGFWVGDYWGVISFGVNTRGRAERPEDVARPAQARVQEQGGAQRQSAHVGLGQAGVFAAAIANGGSLTNIGPGIDFFAKLKNAGNFIPVQATPQTIASGQTPITIDWDYLNLAYGKEFPAAKIKTIDPVGRRLRRVLLPGDQRDRPAPVGGAALAGVPLLGPGPAALAQGVLAPGAVHRHGRGGRSCRRR